MNFKVAAGPAPAEFNATTWIAFFVRFFRNTLALRAVVDRHGVHDLPLFLVDRNWYAKIVAPPLLAGARHLVFARAFL